MILQLRQECIFAAMKLLMVCLGNICRSPLAEGIMKHRVRAAGLNWEVDSAGTGGYHVGEPPHVLSQKVSMCNGIDISTQQCRQFRKEDMDRFDRILVMDANNYREVKRISGNRWNRHKVSLLLDAVYPGENREVPDPWYGTEKDYHTVFKMIDEACEKLVTELAKPDR
jgi:protein-tyrosine phosphatase